MKWCSELEKKRKVARKGEDWREGKGMEVDLERAGKTREVKWREEKWSEDKWSEEKRSEDKRREENWREEKRREERGEGVLRSLRDTLRGDQNNMRHWLNGKRSMNNWGRDIHEEKEFK